MTAAIAHTTPILWDGPSTPPASVSLRSLSSQPARMVTKTSYNHYFHRIISEIAPTLRLRYVTQNEDTWVGALMYEDQCWPIMGFDIGLNSSAVKACCDDKVATSFILTQNKVQNVEHSLFRKNPSVWGKIAEFLKERKSGIVCKPNGGTGGKDVFHLTKEPSLKPIISEMFTRSQYGDVCLSPYYEIKHEYRLIMLDHEPEIVFTKERPQVTGNGKDTLEQLIPPDHLSRTDIEKERLSEIPEEGVTVNLTWKHNLCYGATAKLIHSFEDKKDLVSLASRASKAVGARFVSVDIIETKDGELRVLEINNGVMTEHLINQHKDLAYEKVKAMFKKAIARLCRFGEGSASSSPR